MTTYTTNIGRSTGIAGGSAFRRMTRRIGTWLRMRHQYRDLSDLPDYLLDDIGLTRGDVETAVRRSRLL
jgi:uncharacterized protein YjiS (DUF1127 family)